MRKTYLLAVACSVLTSAIVFTTLDAQTPAPAEKTAGEVMKNVQVLKDIPASDLVNTMWFIAGSLGVPCQHCHVNPNDSDVKPAKLTARTMIQMTRDLHAASFGGRPIVTCNTCHQGSLRPNGVPNYWGKDNKTPEQIAAYLKERQPAPAPGPPGAPAAASPAPIPSPTPATAAPLPSVDTLFENYRKAVSPIAVTSMHLSADLDPDLGAPLHLEVFVEFPDRIDFTVSSAGVVQARQVLNGERGWVVSPAGVVVATPDMVTNFKGLVQSFAPVKVSTSTSARTVTGIETMGDRSYYVVESRDAKARMRLYFDTHTGVLYKTHGETFTPLGSYPYETIFTDYRDVNGVKLPATMKHHGTSGGVTYKFVDMEINVAVDPKHFEPPAAK